MPLPVISVAQMREWEKVTWANGQTEQAVIQQAGQAVGQRAMQLTKPGELIVVFAGKGHNGDDAQVAALTIQDREVKVVKVFDPEAVIRDLPKHLNPKPALIIDGLFGIGLNRTLAGAWVKLIQLINQSGCPILAVDVPSGLNADTGEPLDDAIRATCTLTLGAAKQGLLRPRAWPFVGRLESVAEIGLMPYPFSTEISVMLPEDFQGFPPPRPANSHKGTFGHLAIIAGSFGYHGAAVLAARGAQRAQPGLITLFTEQAVYQPVAEQLQSVMVKTWDGDFALPENATAILFGPGLASPSISEQVKSSCRKLWLESPLPVIVDASALNWLPEGAVQALRVITPHPGEAAKMLGSSSIMVQEDRPAALRQLSKKWGDCHVVLKGHQTMVGREHEEIFVNCSGNPHLAQGGSGDLLAGYMAGLVAQPPLQTDATRTICYSVWQHGAAADALQARRPNWTIEELADELGSVVVSKGETTVAAPL